MQSSFFLILIEQNIAGADNWRKNVRFLIPLWPWFKVKIVKKLIRIKI